MATIVKHNKTGKHYILLGTSYSFYKDSRPSFLGGTLFPHEEEGEFEVAAVCNEKGIIGWFRTEELTVVEIDGTCPKEVLKKYANENENESGNNAGEICPACGETVRYWDRECPECGLTLIPDDTEDDDE